MLCVVRDKLVVEFLYTFFFFEDRSAVGRSQIRSFQILIELVHQTDHALLRIAMTVCNEVQELQIHIVQVVERCKNAVGKRSIVANDAHVNLLKSRAKFCAIAITCRKAIRICLRLTGDDILDLSQRREQDNERYGCNGLEHVDRLEELLNRTDRFTDRSGKTADRRKHIEQLIVQVRDLVVCLLAAMTVLEEHHEE